MTVAVYKKKTAKSNPLGYVAKVMHEGKEYSFAGFTPEEATGRAIDFITKAKKA
jgi:hypothetical protein